MSRPYYYDNSAYTFNPKQNQGWSSGIDSVLKLSQKNPLSKHLGYKFLDTERGASRIFDENLNKPKSSYFQSKESKQIPANIDDLESFRGNRPLDHFAYNSKVIFFVIDLISLQKI